MSVPVTAPAAVPFSVLALSAKNEPPSVAEPLSTPDGPSQVLKSL